MKKFLFYIALTYLALSAQAILFSAVKPDLVLVLVCFYSLKYGQTKGMLYGGISGLLIDISCGFILGPHMISKVVAGFLLGSVREQLFQWNSFINTCAVAVLSVMNIALVYLVLETFSGASFANRSWGVSFWEIIYTIIASLILYPVFRPETDNLDHSFA